MRIATVIGARPQFVKAATVSRALHSASGVEEILIHTGQHFDDSMSKVFFDELDITEPAYNLGVGGGTHGAQTGRMLEAVEAALREIDPDIVLVYGDTNSTLAASLAAAKMRLPLAHVEAGLRSFNRSMPEEINRVVTDHLSNILFAPTLTAVENLRREGLSEKSIHLVGDVMYDSALYSKTIAEKKSSILKLLGLAPKKYILATVHRAENTDASQRLKAILLGLLDAGEEAGLPVILPLHPRTRQAILTLAPEFPLNSPHLRLIEPVGYIDMIMLEQKASLVATDSGGVQKEAYFFKVPCVTLREETEWTELLELGWNRLIAPHSARTVKDGVLSGLAAPPGRNASPYGDGDAAANITNTLLSLRADSKRY